VGFTSTVAALLMEVTYGMNITSHEDKFLRASDAGMELTKRVLVPGTFLVDTVPIREFHAVFKKHCATEALIDISEACPGVVSWSRIQNFREGSPREI
jgi:hypothetical protein